MKLLTCEATNFGSYSHLEFDFSNLGLALVHGPTGAGKSTLFDMACWAMFGITAKDGNSDEVRSWLAPDEKTVVILKVNYNDLYLTLTRTRGKSSENDLYWTEGDSEEKIRGKDLNDTQQLLGSRLGFSADLFLIAAYYSEFSPSGSFFMAKAKEKRELFEKVANLDLAVRLLESSSELRSSLKKKLEGKVLDKQAAEFRLAETVKSISRAAARRVKFEQEQTQVVFDLKSKAETFDQDRDEKIRVLDHEIGYITENLSPTKYLSQEKSLRESIDKASNKRCPTCSNVVAGPEIAKLQAELVEVRTAVKQEEYECKRMRQLEHQLQELTESVNSYTEQAQTEMKRKNPFTAEIKDLTVEKKGYEKALKDATIGVSQATGELTSMEHLYQLSFQLRGMLLKRTVRSIQEDTNTYLEKHFDSEIRVQFCIEDADKLTVSITKDGYEAVYKQLSKGQRQLLRLCFSLSVMKAASNKAGVHFDNLFFDEPTDGCDADLKVRSHDLFSVLSLNHESVLVIDHSSELKGLFNKQYQVTIEGNESSIHEES